MTREQFQAALDLDQPCTCEVYDERIFSPQRGNRIYYLEHLVSMSRQSERLQILFYKQQPFTVRHFDQKQTFTDLSSALRGGRGAWRLAGFGVSHDGLILEFMPSRNHDLMDAADKLLTQVNQPLHTNGRGDKAKPVYLRGQKRIDVCRQYERELYDRFATTLYLTGEFQAQFVYDSENSDLVICSHDKITVVTVRKRRKHLKVVFFRRGDRPAKIYHYT